MRAVALHEDVIVFVSDVWQTTCTAVRGGEEGFLVDSPVYPEELRAVPDVLEQAQFNVSGLLATHGDWDHLLGRLAYPGGALGAAESTVARLSAEIGEPQRNLREFDAEHYVPDRPPLALGALQSLPVPGRLELGTGEQAHELELHPVPGHTADGAAFWMPWAATLVCGDYLSPVEIPMLNPSGSALDYQATLSRLGELVAQAQWVIPGHGAPLSRSRAQEIMAEDVAYVDELVSDPAAARPPASRTTSPSQRKIHDENVARLNDAAA